MLCLKYLKSNIVFLQKVESTTSWTCMFKDNVDTSFGYLLRLSIAGKRSCLK